MVANTGCVKIGQKVVKALIISVIVVRPASGVVMRSADVTNCSRNRDRILDRIRIRDHIRIWACYRNHLKWKISIIKIDILEIETSVPSYSFLYSDS